MFKALTIAGSDSGGGAGMQTDLKTFAALGVYGTSVITALTAQNTRGVHGIHSVPATFIVCQLEAVLSDIPVQAAKTGMLGEATAIKEVARMLTKHRLASLVVDPVMVAQSGDALLAQDAISVLRDKLLPLALLVTPNLPEAGVLLDREITSLEQMETAARDIHLLGPRYVLVKGGHLPGEKMVDVFYDGKDTHHLSVAKIKTSHTHGTGCTYAAAVTAYLARGHTPLEAVHLAKNFITTAIRHGLCVGQGYGPTDPMGGLRRELAERRVSEELCHAFLTLQTTPGAAKLLAPGVSNLYFCLEEASTTKDLAAFPAPFFVCDGQIRAAAGPVFGHQSWAADLLLSIHRQNARIRSLLVLRFAEEALEASEVLGWALGKLGELELPELPCIVMGRGGPSEESFIGLLGSSPAELVRDFSALAGCFRSC